ncbi:trace amine-associated receptor 9-like [Amphiura filiformis]|uniref:trace amine-associated receptor 9-like n=1 Tax=Amphiura filiformis TaxID=82378 RepID=UPI003B21D66B
MTNNIEYVEIVATLPYETQQAPITQTTSEPCPAVIGLRTVFITFHAIFTILANFVCIYVIRHTNAMSDGAKVFMVSMAVSDLFVGVIAFFSIAPAFLGWWPWGDSLCIMTAAFVTIFCLTSVSSLMCVSIDRIIAVCNPLRYPSLVTRKRSLVVTTIVWFSSFSIIAGLWHISPPVEYNNASVTCAWMWEDDTQCLPVAICICLSLFVVPCIIMIVLYLKLFLISQKHVRRIAASSMTPDSIRRSSSQRSTSSGNRFTNDHKAIKMFFVVTFAFTVAWAPYSISSLFGCLTGVTIPEWSKFLVHWLAFSNSWFNVIIYVCMNTALRNTAVSLLRRNKQCCCGCCDSLNVDIPAPSTKLVLKTLLTIVSREERSK